MLLAACTSLSDSRVRQKAVGTWTWTPDGIHSKTLQNRADGSYVITIPVNPTNTLTEEGTWQVKGGFIIGKTTKAAWTNDTLEVWSNKVVSIDDRKMGILTPDGWANEATWYRK